MKTKTVPAAYAPPDESPGFEAIVSVFNNVDFVGDVVKPGAFTDSIATWQKSGDPIPVLWSHRFEDPHCNIGAVKAIEELAGGDPRIPAWANDHVKAHGGLWVKAELDDFGLAGQVRHLLKSRRVTQFSFTYDVLDEKPGKDGTNELHKLWLHEVGPTPIGANPLTTLVGAKTGVPNPEPPDEQAPEDKRPGLAEALFSYLAFEAIKDSTY